MLEKKNPFYLILFSFDSCYKTLSVRDCFTGLVQSLSRTNIQASHVRKNLEFEQRHFRPGKSLKVFELAVGCSTINYGTAKIFENFEI